jgi:hypothetical protein
MELTGHVSGGVVVFDADAQLPEGTQVRILPVADAEPKTLAQRLQNVIGKATSLPADMAAQHDHYIHGAPKR